MNVIVEADGGSRGNPGPAGYGAVVLRRPGHGGYRSVALVREVGAVRFDWVPRSRKARADALANQAMDAQAGAR